MNYMDVLIALAVIGGLGLAFGLLLAVVAKIFAVEADERVEAISAILPGANCGGCGYPGCGGLAEAIVRGEAPVTACAAGGNTVAGLIAEVMGVEAELIEDSSAVVFCSGGDRAKRRFIYEGLTDCYAMSKVAGGDLQCTYGCLGLGSCMRACKFGAIEMVDNLAKIDVSKCTSCGACTRTCPRNIIHMVPRKQDVRVLCSSNDKGANLREFCEIGCIGCKLCQRACPSNAIEVEDNLARIDYTKCTNCALCVEKCPRRLIVDINGVVELYDPKTDTMVQAQ